MSAFYDILSIRNPAVKELVRLRLGGRRARLQRGLALVRGRQLIQSMGEHFKFKHVYTHEDRSAGSYQAERVIRVEKSVLRHAIFGPSREEHANRLDEDDFVLGTISPPKTIQDFEPAPQFLLAVDGVKYPENMGLLLTSAVALKFDGVVFTQSCVDPYNYKVLEASQAVAWTMPHRYASGADLLEICKKYKLLPCAATADGMPLSELPSSLSAEHRGFCLVVGSESTGVSPDVLQYCKRVALPMSELMESLNAGVAGGILMHALACTWRSL